MGYFKNKSEPFFREIRRIEIYDASAVTFENNFQNIFPDPKLAKHVFDVIPETFTRKIPTKKSSGSYSFEPDFGFPLLDMSKVNVDILFADFNREGFAVVLVSNMQKTLIGNDQEPLIVEIIDNVKDDNSGNDEYSISITGSTIIYPKFALL